MIERLQKTLQKNVKPPKPYNHSSKKSKRKTDTHKYIVPVTATLLMQSFLHKDFTQLVIFVFEWYWDTKHENLFVSTLVQSIISATNYITTVLLGEYEF